LINRVIRRQPIVSVKIYSDENAYKTPAMGPISFSKKLNFDYVPACPLLPPPANAGWGQGLMPPDALPETAFQAVDKFFSERVTKSEQDPWGIHLTLGSLGADWLRPIKSSYPPIDNIGYEDVSDEHGRTDTNFPLIQASIVFKPSAGQPDRDSHRTIMEHGTAVLTYYASFYYENTDTNTNGNLSLLYPITPFSKTRTREGFDQFFKMKPITFNYRLTRLSNFVVRKQRCEIELTQEGNDSEYYVSFYESIFPPASFQTAWNLPDFWRVPCFNMTNVANNGFDPSMQPALWKGIEHEVSKMRLYLLDNSDPPKYSYMPSVFFNPPDYRSDSRTKSIARQTLLQNPQWSFLDQFAYFEKQFGLNANDAENYPYNAPPRDITFHRYVTQYQFFEMTWFDSRYAH